MDIKKRVDKLYKQLQLSKMKTQFLILSKSEKLPKPSTDTIQVLLII